MKAVKTGYETLPKGTRLEAPKQCSCGLVHHHLPEVGKVTSMGIWFDCECGSNNLVLNHQETI